MWPNAFDISDLLKTVNSFYHYDIFLQCGSVLQCEINHKNEKKKIIKKNKDQNMKKKKKQDAKYDRV